MGILFGFYNFCTVLGMFIQKQVSNRIVFMQEDNLYHQPYIHTIKVNSKYSDMKILYNGKER